MEQIKNVAEKYYRESRNEKLERLNDRKKIFHLTNKVSDYRRFTKHIAENNIPRVQKVIRAALDRGSGINCLIDQLTRAISGKLS